MKADFQAKKIIYNNNPIDKWCLSNTVIKQDENENIRPIKPSNQRKRIDGAMALIDAYVVYERNKEEFLNIIWEEDKDGIKRFIWKNVYK